MRFDILTIFPEITEQYTRASILGRAQKGGTISARSWDIREFATDKHHTVDDTPYGGGPGMVMKIEPIDKTLTAVHQDSPTITQRRTVVLSARGTPFTQAKAKELAALDQLILICGRYEGIDQRVADHLADEEISIGPYVLAGGELAALVVMEAVARHIPGVLGNSESLTEESHSQPTTDTKTSFIEYPQYTKPEEYNGLTVPSVLLSGDHAKIQEWRRNVSDDNLNT